MIPLPFFDDLQTEFFFKYRLDVNHGWKDRPEAKEEEENKEEGKEDELDPGER